MEQNFSLIREYGADDNDFDDDDDDDDVVCLFFHCKNFLSGIFSLHVIHSCLFLLRHATLSINRRRRMGGNKLVRVCKEAVVN